MADALDSVQTYARAIGLEVQPRTVVVEGTSDVDLFQMAAKFERQASGIDLFAGGFTIVAAGIGDAGGTTALRQKLVPLREIAKTVLLQSGAQKYRFVGIVDNDRAGRQVVSELHGFDTSILEFKDVFRLFPTMPIPSDLDPTSLKKRFESENAPFKGLDWELEDLLPDSLVEAFIVDNPSSVIRSTAAGGRIHRDFTRDGKARLHRFVKENAMRDDLSGVVTTLKAMRSYLGLRDGAVSRT